MRQLYSKPTSSTGEPALGVAGIPFVEALLEEPILSIQVRQFEAFPPIIKPLSKSTSRLMLKPSLVICESI